MGLCTRHGSCLRFSLSFSFCLSPQPYKKIELRLCIDFRLDTLGSALLVKKPTVIMTVFLDFHHFSRDKYFSHKEEILPLAQNHCLTIE